MRDAAEQLDDVSAQLAEILRHADQLLDEWARFGVQVRAQVEREAQAVGDAAARAVDASAQRLVHQQLATLTAELGKLETRARAAGRAIAIERARERVWLVGIAAGVAVAIVLLVVLVLRSPAPPPVQPLAPEPIPTVVPAATPIDAGVPDAPPPPPADAAAPADAARARHR
jgi:hypothetical protein